jgi:hypothetical protein
MGHDADDADLRADQQLTGGKDENATRGVADLNAAQRTPLTLEAAHALHSDSPRACTVYGDFRERAHSLRRLAALLEQQHGGALRSYAVEVVNLAGELERLGACAIADVAASERPSVAPPAAERSAR